MATITVNERSKAGKELLRIINALFRGKPGVKVVEEEKDEYEAKTPNTKLQDDIKEALSGNTKTAKDFDDLVKKIKAGV
jgi:hypothetical protein